MNTRSIRNGVEYRSFDDEKYLIEGYASTFERYELFRDGNNIIYEQVDPHAFDEADMTDAVLRVDHAGKVYARSSAGTLKLDVDDHGLHFIADLSRTADSRALYEDIKAGNYPKASYAYRVEEESFNEAEMTRTITKIAKVYDVSPVTWPQNPTTDVTSRKLLDGEVEGRKLAERLAREKDVKRLAIKLKLLNM